MKIFSITLFHKEFKNLFITLVIATIILCLTLPFAHITFMKKIDSLPRSNNEITGTEISDIMLNSKLSQNLSRDSLIQLVFTMLFPLGVACFILGNDRLYNTNHLLATMPFSRLQIICSKILAGVITVVLPFVFVYIISLFQHRFIDTISAAYTLQQLNLWLASSILPSLLMFALGLVSASIFAPYSVGIVMAFIFSFMTSGLYRLVELSLTLVHKTNNIVISSLQYLVYISPLNYLTQGTKLEYEKLFLNNTQLLLATGLFALVLLAIAIYLFKKSPFENNHEVLILKSFKPFFKLSSIVFIALVIAPLIQLSFGGGLIILVVGYLVGGIFGYQVSKNFMKKFN